MCRFYSALFALLFSFSAASAQEPAHPFPFNGTSAEAREVQRMWQAVERYLDALRIPDEAESAAKVVELVRGNLLKVTDDGRFVLTSEAYTGFLQDRQRVRGYRGHYPVGYEVK